MAVRGVANHGERMPLSLRNRPEPATGAYQLQRAAGGVLRDASAPDAVPALPVALAHLEEALDRLSISMVKTAQAVEEWPGAAEAETATLSAEARALRWHLFHLATRLRSAQDACPETRRWARQLLHQARSNPLTAESPSPEGAL
jgi:hypothetical protein